LKLLTKTYRELKPGGKLIMTVWNLGSDWAKKKIKKDWIIVGEGDCLIPWKDNKGKVIVERYYHHFTKKEIKELLKKAGFKVEQIGYASHFGWSDERGGKNLLVVAKKEHSG
jgi:ubiquinone/menaquinone biosynthesis C-methylase UbiE